MWIKGDGFWAYDGSVIEFVNTFREENVEVAIDVDICATVFKFEVELLLVDAFSFADKIPSVEVSLADDSSLINPSIQVPAKLRLPWQPLRWAFRQILPATPRPYKYGRREERVEELDQTWFDYKLILEYLFVSLAIWPNSYHGLTIKGINLLEQLSLQLLKCFWIAANSLTWKDILATCPRLDNFNGLIL